MVSLSATVVAERYVLPERNALRYSMQRAAISIVFFFGGGGKQAIFQSLGGRGPKCPLDSPVITYSTQQHTAGESIDDCYEKSREKTKEAKASIGKRTSVIVCQRTKPE